MTVIDTARVRFTEIKPKIGSIVHASKAALLSGDYADKILDMLERRGVLVFPELHFNDEEQVAFTKTLGPLAHERSGEEVYNITLDKSLNPTADYLKGAFYWHFDGYMNEVPIRASLLSSKVLSPTGGNTEFANNYAAYDALPDERKKQIENLRAVHAMVTSQLYHTPEPSYEQFMAWRAVGRVELPLVWKHKSGRKSLVVGSSACNILGMDPLDGVELLVFLRDWATQDQFRCSHKWSVGDMVMWDNTGTLHRATQYPLDCGRLLHRTKLQGAEPII
jgi:alpha-ketoglutarate-dependent taurine dioxygenase